MKGLTLTQPYASLIACGAKQVETRSWKPADHMIGQAIAIHAAENLKPVGGPDGLRNLCETFPFDIALWKGGYNAPQPSPGPPYRLDYDRILGERGHLVCEAVLLAVRPTGEFREHLARNGDFREICFGDYMPGRWAWVLEQVHRYPEPIPCRGGRSLWDVPDDLAQRLAERALAEGRDHL